MIKSKENPKSLALSLLEKIDELSIENSSNIFTQEMHENDEKYDDEYINKLKLCYKNLQTRCSFQEEQVVTWKKYMQNKKLPKEKQPAIVLKVLDVPIVQDKIPLGSTYYGEVLDMVLGMFNEDGSFLTFYYDSIRFEPYENTNQCKQRSLTPR